MDIEFLIFLYVIIFLIPTILLILLKVSKAHNSVNGKVDKRFYKKYKSLFYIIIGIIGIIYLTNKILPDYHIPSEAKERVKYGKKRGLTKLVEDSYKELLSKDEMNIDYLYHYLQAHYSIPKTKYDSHDNLIFYRHDHALKPPYKKMTKSPDQSVRDYGYFSLSMQYFLEKDEKKYKSHIDSIINKNLKYYDLLISEYHLRKGEIKKSENHLLKSIQKHPTIDEQYDKLIGLYFATKQYEKAIPYAYDKSYNKYINHFYVSDLYYLNKDFKNFTYNIFTGRLLDTNIIGIIAALIILAAWFLYLYKIDFFERENPAPLIMLLIISMIFTFGCDFIYNYLRYNLEFTLTYNSPNHDLLYSIFGIGATEELIKFLPFLFFLLFTKYINEPYDYILYASVSALGFAFIENLMYFKEDDLVIHGRAISAVIGHMFDSSIIAYGLILAKYKWKVSPIPVFFLFFLLACISHGIYDYLIFYDHLVTFALFYMVCIKIFVTLINNALNNSGFFDYNKKINYEKTKNLLIIVLVSVFIFEYITLSVIYGTKVVNTSFTGQSILGTIILIFLITNLSMIDLEKGKWNSIKLNFNPFIVPDLPMNFTGSIIRFFPKIRNQLIYEELTGTIIDRKCITFKSIWNKNKDINESNWFLVQSNEKISNSDYHNQYFLIKLKDKHPDISLDKDLTASIMMIKKSVDIKGETIINTDLLLAGTIILNKTEEQI